jgi:hypothetical protein
MNMNQSLLPQKDQKFTEKQLHDKFHVRNSGGIRPTIKNKSIILINSYFSDRKLGCKNTIDESSGFVYLVGEGKQDQEFIRNNKHVLKSKQKGFSLLYFEKPKEDELIFKYLLEYDSWKFDNQKNSEGMYRQVILFKLKIIT